MKIVFGSTQVVGTTGLFAFCMLSTVYGYLHYDFTLLAFSAVVLLLFAVHGRRYLLKKALSPARLIILSVASIMTLTFPFALYKTPASLYHYTVGIASILAAYVFSRYPREAYKSLRLTLVAVQSFTIFYLLTTKNTVLPLDHMVENSSSNGITTIIVLLQTAYIGLCFHVERRSPILTPFLTLYICIEGFSRGSILAAVMICVAALLIRVVVIRSSMHRFFSIFLIFLVLAFFFGFWVDPFIEYLLISTKLGQGLLDGARLEMAADYLGKLNFWTALTGADFSGTSIEVKYSGNPHSSIIRAHHLFGIFYLFVIIALVILVVFSVRTFTGKLVTASLTLIILFRSLTEPVLFPTSMDFFVFLYFFIAIDDGKSLKGRTGWAPPYDLANLRSGPGIHAKNFAAPSVFD